jgi:hypothetical protein
MVFIRWIDPLRSIVTCMNSAPFGCGVTCSGTLIPGASCGCEAGVAHAGWSPALLDSRGQTT